MRLKNFSLYLILGVLCAGCLPKGLVRQTSTPTQPEVTAQPTSSLPVATEIPLLDVTPTLPHTATLTPLSTRTATSWITVTPDMWQIQKCPVSPSEMSIIKEDDWIWEYTGDIAWDGEIAMLLNFSKKNEIKGFFFDNEQVREYRVDGCVNERKFTIWLQQDGSVEALIQGEFPETDPRGHYKSSNALEGDVLVGSLLEKESSQSFPVYLQLLRGGAGTMEHRFWIAGVEDDSVILNASKEFLTAIANDDRTKVAQMVRFPLTIQKDLKTTLIKTPESFLTEYEVIFDSGFKARLAKTFPNYLIAFGGNFLGTIGQYIYGGGGIDFDDHGKVTSISIWQKPTPTPWPSPTSTPTVTNTPTLLPKPSRTLTPALPTPTFTPGIGYQLTYASECQVDSQCMYAINVGCLESKTPCQGEPQLLFVVSKKDQGPKPPIAYSVWSPDGKQVAIGATGVQGQGDVFVGDWNGKNWVNLTNSPIFEGDPAWSPDGLYISYSGSSGEPDYHGWAFIITSDGKHVERIMASENLSGIDGLSWSPDGQQVVFMHSDNNGYYQLFISNPDGSGLKQLTDQLEDHFNPHFSPDGKWIVATRELGKYADTQQYEIILIKSDGSGETKVIYQSNNYLYDSIWSPIGNWIAFTEGDSGINIIRSDGSGLMRVSDNNASIFAPTWRIIISP